MTARRRPESLATREARRTANEHELLRNPELSNRRIAALTTSDPKTVAGVRGDLERAGRIPSRTRHQTPQAHGGALLNPEKGNQRAATHGAWSAQRVGPVRERHLQALRAEFPAVDQRLLSVQAQRMAQYELLTAWLDGHGVVKGRGDVHRAAEFAERLARSFEAQFDKLRDIQREATTVDPAASLEAVVQDITSGRSGTGG